MIQHYRYVAGQNLPAGAPVSIDPSTGKLIETRGKARQLVKLRRAARKGEAIHLQSDGEHVRHFIPGASTEEPEGANVDEVLRAIDVLAKVLDALSPGGSKTLVIEMKAETIEPVLARLVERRSTMRPRAKVSEGEARYRGVVLRSARLKRGS